MGYQKTHTDLSSSETTSGHRTFRTKLIFSLVIFTAFSFYFSSSRIFVIPMNLSVSSNTMNFISNVMKVEFQDEVTRLSRRVSSVHDLVKYESFSVLLPDWEVLVIISPETHLTASHSVKHFYCLFSRNHTSPARFSGVLPFTELAAFKCIMPKRLRRPPYWQPVLTKNPWKEAPAKERELLRMKTLAYESISTDDDVVLFVKGVNGLTRFRPPQDLMCVFGEDDDEKTAVRTPVTSSTQEVFRCSHPDLTAFASSGAANRPIKISLRIMNENRILPSVAYYTPKRKTASPEEEQKSEICACTMVYNVAKFLKEWVIYHSKIGVEKFMLYDNDSDDDLQNVVNELNRDGYNVNTLLWIWPKTQEAGFSHNAINSKDSCKWMLYVDVDEFVYSPSWNESSQASKEMLKSLIPEKPSTGQVSMECHDFGPSGQKSHPVEGVIQGYTCQRWGVKQQRHKSMVLLEAIDDSLGNAVHHFALKNTFEWRRIKNAVVNHYKYQAWSEFRNKFRRRVSAYVADWREATNPNSNDRTPGLGFEPIEPEGWESNFCDLKDDRLKLLAQRWFGEQTPNGYKMAWQK